MHTYLLPTSAINIPHSDYFQQCIYVSPTPSHTHAHTHTHTHTVTNLRAVNTTTNSTTITWDQPPHNYRVFLHGEATDNIPQSRVIQLVTVTGQTTHNIGGLDSFRNYSIGVYLESDHRNGSDATVTVSTTGRGAGAEGIMSLSAYLCVTMLYVRAI